MRIPYKDIKLCECGCRQQVKPGNRFLPNHHWRKGGYNATKTSKRMRENNPTNNPYTLEVIVEATRKRMLANNPMQNPEVAIKVTGENNGRWKPELHVVKQCKCGCGQLTEPGNNYITGHNRRKPCPLFTPVVPCECGCGRLVRHRFATGHANRGKNLNQEWKDRISISSQGKPGNKNQVVSEQERLARSERMKKNNPMNDPKIVRMAVKKNRDNGHYEKSSERMKNNNPMHNPEIVIKNCGPNNWNWRGGVSCEPYCEVWSDKEFKDGIKYDRDNGECQNPDCWKTTTKIMLHHINYIKKDCHPKNLITLCGSCNTRANTNRKYWQFLYTNIIEEIYSCPQIS